MSLFGDVEHHRNKYLQEMKYPLFSRVMWNITGHQSQPLTIVLGCRKSRALSISLQATVVRLQCSWRFPSQTRYHQSNGEFFFGSKRVEVGQCGNNTSVSDGNILQTSDTCRGLFMSLRKKTHYINTVWLAGGLLKNSTGVSVRSIHGRKFPDLEGTSIVFLFDHVYPLYP